MPNFPYGSGALPWRVQETVMVRGTVSGSPGRAEQGVAGIPPGMDAHLSGAPCQSGCQGFVGQGLSAGSFQQGFLNSDPWANWINQRQFYNQQLLLQQQF